MSGCCSFLTSSFSHSLALLSLFLVDFAIDENVLFYTPVSMVTLHRALEGSRWPVKFRVAMGTEQQEKMVDGHLRVSGESVLAGSRGIRLLYSAAHIQDPSI